tara:strand:- start:4038 stop:4409 length:372 start_codon:yes stop_codon:yes gene_type:complete
MPYHPNPDINNNQAPIYDASLSYENHGKCFNSVILSGRYGFEPIRTFRAGVAETPHHGWKVVFLQKSTVTFLEANNIDDAYTNQINTNQGGVIFDAGIEIMADIKRIEISQGLCIIYMNCQQS